MLPKAIARSHRLFDEVMPASRGGPVSGHRDRLDDFDTDVSARLSLTLVERQARRLA
jgi:hypothetical protein